MEVGGGSKWLQRATSGGKLNSSMSVSLRCGAINHFRVVGAGREAGILWVLAPWPPGDGQPLPPLCLRYFPQLHVKLLPDTAELSRNGPANSASALQEAGVGLGPGYHREAQTMCLSCRDGGPSTGLSC